MEEEFFEKKELHGLTEPHKIHLVRMHFYEPP